ncbi:MarR family transcriptional regulator [Corallococcus sp. H22C18031201]|nr:MarR family transcriptional regulator [Corallococcus sp. H22C18031201]
MTLAEQVGALKRVIGRLVRQRVGEDTGRPFMQLLVLKVVETEGLRHQSLIAERLMVDAPAVSRLVDRLAEDGLIERRAGTNRRSVHLEVTDAGRRELKVLRAGLLWLDDEARQCLSDDELQQLTHLMKKLHTGLAQRSSGGPAAADGAA